MIDERTDDILFKTKQKILIAPSILSADFSKLGEELSEVGKYVEMFHVDVMDGHFVPNITFGPPVVKSIRGATEKFLDCHLMISHPWDFIDSFIEVGADGITVHLETCIEEGGKDKLMHTLKKVRAAGKKIGISINPGTSVDSLKEYFPFVDMILLMTVEPGFGGQGFIEDVLSKIKEVRKMIDEGNHKILIEVDGGIKSGTAGMAASAGADILVAGSAIFGKDDRKKAIEDILADSIEHMSAR